MSRMEYDTSREGFQTCPYTNHTPMYCGLQCSPYVGNGTFMFVEL
jgi:hypothetical protein